IDIPVSGPKGGEMLPGDNIDLQRPAQSATLQIIPRRLHAWHKMVNVSHSRKCAVAGHFSSEFCCSIQTDTKRLLNQQRQPLSQAGLCYRQMGLSWGADDGGVELLRAQSSGQILKRTHRIGISHSL